MSLIRRRSAVNPDTNPLPERLAGLLQESRWLLLVALAALLAMSLWGFDAGDPGWSHAGGRGQPVNPAGFVGAWLSDLLLFLFGHAAWWLIVALSLAVWWGYRRLHGPRGEETRDRRSLFIGLAGFLAVLGAVAALETLRFHSHGGDLPSGAGGALGQGLGNWAVTALGFTGATLAALVMVGVGLSLFAGVSWISAAERFGELLERSWFGIQTAWQNWQDRRIGREVARQREAVVEEARVRESVQEHAPVRIEVTEQPVVRSERVEKERQASLFVDASTLPPLHLLDDAVPGSGMPTPETLEYTSRLIERKLADFGVSVQVLAALPGPVITRYEIEPAAGVKGAQVVSLDRDLARALSVTAVRVVETIPGKSCMGLEIPNNKRQTVRLSEILGSQAYQGLSSPLTVALGKDIGGAPMVADLAKMPHLLVAGTTGSGKSVGINAMILSLVYKADPSQVRLILVDPKMLELSVYEGIPHLLTPVVTDMRQAAHALNWCVGEMERRYRLMSALGVRNLAGFNQKIGEARHRDELIPNPFSLTPDAPEPLQTLPNIVVVIDELADLMMVVGKKVEELIARLAQKARAAGIHLILATQRPSVDVITGLIKANIPTRIAFQVSSKIDSRTILDQMGAEALLGQGDMLYLPPGGGYPTRVHGAFVADAEVHKVVEYLKSLAPPDYLEDVLTGADDSADPAGEGSDDAESDPLYDQAVEVVLKNRRASISLVQRHLRIGYNRAARLIEAMESAGLVSAMASNGSRDILAPAREE